MFIFKKCLYLFLQKWYNGKTGIDDFRVHFDENLNLCQCRPNDTQIVTILFAVLMCCNELVWAWFRFLGVGNSFEQSTLRGKYPYSESFWSVFSPNERKYGPEKLRVRTLLMHCKHDSKGL